MSAEQTRVTGGFTERERPAVGLRPAVQYCGAVSLTAAYVFLVVFVLSTPWRSELEQAIGPVAGWVIPLFLAYIPAVVISFFLFSLLLASYREPDLLPPEGAWPPGTWPDVTIVVAARNEESGIGATLLRIAKLEYDGPVSVIVADNGSTDGTATAAHEAAARLGLDLRVVPEPVAGKHHALNTALTEVGTTLVVTVDADTLLHSQSLRYLVAAVTERPQGQHVSACAGALFVEHPNQNFLTRMQRWDYLIAINGVKRMQASYNSTLVAQGAFSVYWTEDVRAVGGWPDAIGEDIVLTWGLLSSCGLVRYEPLAAALTAVPEKLSAFASQRSRWARGMFEGLRISPPYRQPRMLAKLVAAIDYLVPFLDIGVIFFWVPGVILFLRGNPIIFSWWSMLVIPVTLVIYLVLRRWQERNVSRRLGFATEHDAVGFAGYLFAYQVVCSAAALRGYGQYIAGAGRRWK